LITIGLWASYYLPATNLSPGLMSPSLKHLTEKIPEIPAESSQVGGQTSEGGRRERS
jgi:hypothetical protein